MRKGSLASSPLVLPLFIKYFHRVSISTFTYWSPSCYYPRYHPTNRTSNLWGALGSGRTIPSWRMVVEAETAKLKKFQDFLRVEDKLVFHDLLGQCKLYAPYASTMASPVKEVPLLISMLFGQHKKIIELEKKVLTLETILKKSLPSSDSLDLQETPSGTQTAAQLD